MTEHEQDGGTIFPFEALISGNPNRQDQYMISMHGGISLRQHYAGLAMQGVLCDKARTTQLMDHLKKKDIDLSAAEVNYTIWARIAGYAFGVADAMIEEGAKHHD